MKKTSALVRPPIRNMSIHWLAIAEIYSIAKSTLIENKEWEQEENKDVYSLASKEFNDLLTVPYKVIKTDKDIKQIKVARGKKLMEIIKDREIRD